MLMKLLQTSALEIIKVIKEYGKLSPNSHVNMSQSTNDVFPTAIHISTLNLLNKLLVTMNDMHDVFKRKSARI